jgi:pSer/pThr/pTyr-binding forkhead associated (FHA) protein
MTLIITWRLPNGGLGEFILKNGVIYIGRHPECHLLKACENIYIMDEHYNILKDTGLRSRSVSRLHLKIHYEPAKGTIQIVDDGKKGKGSSNGTYIDGKRLATGGEADIIVHDSITLNLTGEGPEFTISTSGTSASIPLKENKGVLDTNLLTDLLSRLENSLNILEDPSLTTEKQKAVVEDLQTYISNIKEAKSIGKVPGLYKVLNSILLLINLTDMESLKSRVKEAIEILNNYLNNITSD